MLNVEPGDLSLFRHTALFVPKLLHEIPGFGRNWLDMAKLPDIMFVELARPNGLVCLGFPQTRHASRLWMMQPAVTSVTANPADCSRADLISSLQATTRKWRKGPL
jgi:hypothetical protein